MGVSFAGKYATLSLTFTTFPAASQAPSLPALYFNLYGEVVGIVHCLLGLIPIEAIREEHLVFKAIFTDSHFWIPLFVLLLGIALLVFLH